MAVRTTMAALIARVRLLINDPSSATQQFADQDIQDVLDESRMDVVNQALKPRPTYTVGTIQYLNYYSQGGWEDDYVFKQYLTVVVTPATLEPIAGHFAFAQSTLPPVYITGKLYDVYRVAADLLERLTARWVLSYNITANGQNLQRSQAAAALQNLAKTYRQKQRAGVIKMIRSDIAASQATALSLDAKPLDYFASGNGNG